MVNPNDPDRVFKDHEAKSIVKNKEYELLEWRNPESSTYAIFYIRWWSTLCVFGDCFEATYQWNWEEGFDLAWIASCDLGYFLGKCRASPHGREPYVWDPQQAEETLKKYFGFYKTGHFAEDRSYDDERSMRAGQEARFNDVGGYRGAWDALSSKDEWTIWCAEHAWGVFGDSWYELTELSNPGRRLDAGVELHLEGLKRAVAQFKEKEDAKIQSDVDGAGAVPCGSESSDGASGA